MAASALVSTHDRLSGRHRLDLEPALLGRTHAAGALAAPLQPPMAFGADW
jgi:hypothetical protein